MPQLTGNVQSCAPAFHAPPLTLGSRATGQACQGEGSLPAVNESAHETQAGGEVGGGEANRGAADEAP